MIPSSTDPDWEREREPAQIPTQTANADQEGPTEPLAATLSPTTEDGLDSEVQNRNCAVCFEEITGSQNPDHVVHVFIINGDAKTLGVNVIRKPLRGRGKSCGVLRTNYTVDHSWAQIDLGNTCSYTYII